uniref:Uncharacterized protein n=1 Tax=Sinocyclocheilus anshuiensis TaxID=1608454 RepID=A0A671M4L8_9TELE
MKRLTQYDTKIPSVASSALLSVVRGAKRDRERILKASFIITCVGSVAKATLGLANATAWNTNEALGRAAGGAAQSATAHGGHCCHSAPGTLTAEVNSQKGNQLRAFHRAWQVC